MVSEAEIDKAVQSVSSAKRFILGRETAHNETLGSCNLSREAAVKALDEMNAELKRLGHYALDIEGH